MPILGENKHFYASPLQRKVLLRLITHPDIENCFFLTGGTALAVFYLHHRVSDDLDLFTLNQLKLSEIDFWIRTQWPKACSKIKEGPNFLSFLIQKTKVEFAIDPLSNREKRSAVAFERGRHLIVDNIDNIVSNKLGAMVSRQEPKDFVDFYFILKAFPALKLEKIYENAKRKDVIFEDPPTAAFQLEEGLSLIKENPSLLPQIRRRFNRQNFYKSLENLAAWIYQRIKI